MFAAIIGVAFLGEPFRGARAGAALLILGGVIALRFWRWGGTGALPDPGSPSSGRRRRSRGRLTAKVAARGSGVAL